MIYGTRMTVSETTKGSRGSPSRPRRCYQVFSAVLAMWLPYSCKSSHSAWRRNPHPLSSAPPLCLPFLSPPLPCPPSHSLREVTGSQLGPNCSNLQTELVTLLPVREAERGEWCLCEKGSGGPAARAGTTPRTISNKHRVLRSMQQRGDGAPRGQRGYSSC